MKKITGMLKARGTASNGPSSSGSLHTGSLMQVNVQTQQASLSAGLYSALMSLGLDISAIEKACGISLSSESLANLPKRAGDMVLHFLFVCIDKEKASKVFRDCWPVIDKRREAQFYKTAFEWYKSLVQQYCNSSSTAAVKAQQQLIVSRVVVSPFSCKFLTTIMTLTKMALKISIERKGKCECALLQPPTFLANNSAHNRTARKLLLAHKVHQHDLLCNTQLNNQSQLQRLHDTAKYLVNEYRSAVSECERLRTVTLNTTEQLSSFDKKSFVLPLGQLRRDVESELLSLNSKSKESWSTALECKAAEDQSYRVLGPLVQATAHFSHISTAQLKPILNQETVHALLKSNSKLPCMFSPNNELILESLLQTAVISARALCSSVPPDKGNIPSDVQTSASSDGDQNVTEQRASSLSSCVLKLIEDTGRCASSLKQDLSHYQPCPSSNDGPTLMPLTPPLHLNRSRDSQTPHRYSPLCITPGTMRCSTLTQGQEQKQFNNTLFNVSSPQLSSPKVNQSEGMVSANQSLPAQLLSYDQRATHQHRKKLFLNSAATRSNNASFSAYKSKIPSSLHKTASRSCNKMNSRAKENDKNVANVKESHKFARRRIISPCKSVKTSFNAGSDAIHSDSFSKLASIVASGLADTETLDSLENDPKPYEDLDKYFDCNDVQDQISLLTPHPSDVKYNATPLKPSDNTPGSTPYVAEKSSVYASPLLKKYPLPPSALVSEDQSSTQCDAEHNNETSKTLCVDKSSAIKKASNAAMDLMNITTGNVTPKRDSTKVIFNNSDNNRLENIFFKKDINNVLPVEKYDFITSPPEKFHHTETISSNMPKRPKEYDEVSSASSNVGIVNNLRNENETHKKSLLDKKWLMEETLFESKSVLSDSSSYSDPKTNSSLMQSLREENAPLIKKLIGNDFMLGDTEKSIVSGVKCNAACDDSGTDRLLPSIREATMETTDLDQYLSLFESRFLKDDSQTSNQHDTSPQDFNYEEQIFVDGSVAAEFLGLTEPPMDDTSSSVLPPDSVFQTLRDSILTGETDASLLQDKDVCIRVDRESLCMSMPLSGGRNSRRSSASSCNKRLSHLFTEFQRRVSTETGILDVSDSILLSTSFE